jgi:starch phosphorylase
VTGDGLSFDEAAEVVRSCAMFTTHTPVPAGIDRFPADLMLRYFRSWANECGVAVGDLLALGHFPGEESEAPFNMAVLCLRLAGLANGVSRLHGVVSRRMFQPLWPNLPVEEVPIGSVTNGVHGRTWVSPDMNDLYTRSVLPAWDEAGSEDWSRIDEVGDDELWRAREQGRQALVNFVRARLRKSLMDRGVTESDARWCDDALDPRVLTVGFARRFAGYKRPTLMLSQPERLQGLLLSPETPVQLVFAGKAHPDDDIGHDMIRRLVEFSRDPAVRHRIAFVEDYDISVARMLYQGSDVWLNTPRRPNEACGTSGEKAALSGALNCSVLDGWWDEMFDGANGWAISSAESYEDLDQRDRMEADSLFDILEHQVVPLFYDRSEGGVPSAWIKMVKASLRSLGPRVTASRMVHDYADDYYEPLALRADTLRASGYARARSLVAWKQRVHDSWDRVAVRSVDTDAAAVTSLGTTCKVTAVVSLGSLGPEDVSVELLHGAVGPDDELDSTSVETLSMAGLGDAAGNYRYEGELTFERPGRYGLNVRVVPHNPDLAVAVEMGCIAWG